MTQERYTLILKHEAIYGEDSVQLDQPLVIRYFIDRRFADMPVLLNRMMDQMKDALIRKASENEVRDFWSTEVTECRK